MTDLLSVPYDIAREATALGIDHQPCRVRRSAFARAFCIAQ
jgi:hypothetical protein